MSSLQARGKHWTTIKLSTCPTCIKCSVILDALRVRICISCFFNAVTCGHMVILFHGGILSLIQTNSQTQDKMKSRCRSARRHIDGSAKSNYPKKASATSCTTLSLLANFHHFLSLLTYSIFIVLQNPCTRPKCPWLDTHPRADVEG